MNRRQFYLYAGAVILLALLVREYFVLVAQVRSPYGGDASEYIAYAEHLLAGWFGKGAVPDAYRTPGYPLFVMLSMWPGDWYTHLMHMQAIVGTLTVAGTISLTRQFAPRGWALAAGVLIALWPHHIAATGEVLSEVLLGGLIVLALLLSTRRYAVAAGIAFGLGYLINPILALFPFVVAFVYWRDGFGKQGLTMLLVSLVAVAGWGIRNTSLGVSGNDRAYINLVQGSYPLYQAAYVSRNADPEPARIIAAITAEQTAMEADHAQGLQTMLQRMQREPSVYVRWYLSKPFLLWDWDVRIGEGGPYVHQVYKSPLEGHPLLRATTSLLKAANPLLFALSLAFAAWTVWRRQSSQIVALAFLYLTAIHVVLQADPRYATAYRPMEVLLAMCALSAVYARIESARHRSAECRRAKVGDNGRGVIVEADGREYG